jgi:hypothetical protein
MTVLSFIVAWVQDTVTLYNDAHAKWLAPKARAVQQHINQKPKTMDAGQTDCVALVPHVVHTTQIL